jgi:hypothetical protein
VFARGAPEVFGISVEAGQAIDVIEFLWASLTQFDAPVKPDKASVYRPLPFAPYPVAEAARDSILRLMDEAPDGAPLDRFLPDLAEHANGEAR